MLIYKTSMTSAIASAIHSVGVLLQYACAALSLAILYTLQIKINF